MYREGYTQQYRMGQPPRVLSNKDCNYLTDALSWELLASKKAHFLARKCSDKPIKHQQEQISQQHQTHYDILLTQLNTTEHDHDHFGYQGYRQ